MPDLVLTTTHPVACVDLRATFAGRFRFEWDESYAAERPEFRAIEAPWLTVIPGRFGRIFPWRGHLLAAYTAARPEASEIRTEGETAQPRQEVCPTGFPPAAPAIGRGSRCGLSQIGRWSPKAKQPRSYAEASSLWLTSKYPVVQHRTAEAFIRFRP